VTGEQVRDTTFLFTRGGYDVAEVDDLLRSIAAELDAGRPVEPLVRNATFRARWRGAQGYDVAAVDWFLGQFLLDPGLGELAGMSADPWRELDAVGGRFTRGGAGDRDGRSARQSRRALREHYIEECWEAWDEFGQQPGTYLRLEWVRIARCEIRSVDLHTIASMTYRWPDTIWAYPDIPETCDRVSTGKGNFVFVRTRARKPRKLVDETGVPVLYTSGRNFGREAQASVSFPDGRSLRFPVRGTHRANAIMTAVDEAGNSVARYRITRFTKGGLRHNVEVALHPGRELTDELILAITISAPQLSSYFSVQRGG